MKWKLKVLGIEGFEEFLENEKIVGIMKGNAIWEILRGAQYPNGFKMKKVARKKKDSSGCLVPRGRFMELDKENLKYYLDRFLNRGYIELIA